MFTAIYKEGCLRDRKNRRGQGTRRLTVQNILLGAVDCENDLPIAGVEPLLSESARDLEAVCLAFLLN